jgi:hypothetical protein
MIFFSSAKRTAFLSNKITATAIALLLVLSMITTIGLLGGLTKG